MRLTLVIYLLFIIGLCKAQQPGYTSFTVNDGLPSNYIYSCVEDNKGFLWIATDAGIARFDGMHFQVFTTMDGLPDNEVLDVVKEINGRIWINCFKQNPAYFDETQNRFINANTDTNLAKSKQGTSSASLFALPEGGVMYANERGCFVFKNKKLVTTITKPDHAQFLIKENKDGSQLRYGEAVVDPVQRISNAQFYLVKNDNIADSAFLVRSTGMDFPSPAVNGDVFFDFYSARKKVFVYSDIKASPFRFKTDSVSIPETFFYYSFTGPWINLYTHSGKIYVINRKTLKLQFIVKGDFIPNSMFLDGRGNMWICTIDKGLLLSKKEQSGHLNLPEGFKATNFLSIARKPDGIILAGNYNGQILEADGKVNIIHPSPQKDTAIIRQRKILLSNNKIFSFSENGIFVNFTNKLVIGTTFLFGKTAINFNDSIIVVGQTSGLRTINTVNESTRVLRKRGMRITALAKVNGSLFYYGSTDGLYKYNLSLDREISLQKNHLLSERVTGLCITPDSILWVATASDGLVGVKNDSVIVHITEAGGMISNATRSIMAGKPGQLWVGTWAGISVINYRPANNQVSFSIQNLSVHDGLTNNVINEMIYSHDTIYAATSDGISVIPANISIPRYNIPVELVGISINQRDTALATTYNLPYNQHDIQLQLAGIELSGHFKNLQYTLDKNSNWVNLKENILALQLTSGSHLIRVRAVDVNGHISNKILTVTVNIATPFWKAVWFWVIVAIGSQLTTMYLVNRWLKKKKETKLAREMAIVQTASLEQQAFTSLLSPHFMFNALNSIQHYINFEDRKNANRYLSDFASLIRKSFEASQRSFIALGE